MKIVLKNSSLSFAMHAIDETTLALIDNLASGVYDNRRKSAFNTLVVTLKNANLFDSIVWINVPSLATTKDDAVTNLVDGTVAASTSGTNADNQNYIMAKYGLYAKVVADYTNNPITGVKKLSNYATLASGIVSKESSYSNSSFYFGLGNLMNGGWYNTTKTLSRTGTINKGVNSLVTSVTIDGNGKATSLTETTNGGTYTSATLSSDFWTDIKATGLISFCGIKNFANNMLQDKAMNAIDIIFNINLNESQSALVSNAINSYINSIYDEDIDNIIL